MSEPRFFAGVDVGSRTAKAVVLRGSEVAALAAGQAGSPEEVLLLLEEALKSAGALLADTPIGVTGVGRSQIGWAALRITDVTAAGLAAAALFPGVRTVVEVGAEDARAILTDGAGRVLDSAVNEKCASGSGSFLEAMARALSMTLPEFGEAGRRGVGNVRLSAQCAVFAESEVVGMIHQNVPLEEISRAIHDSVAARVAGMAKKLGTAGETALFGGLAQNPCFVERLSAHLGSAKILVPDHPLHADALGAALAAKKRAERVP